MKTIIRKVNFRYFFRRSLYLLVISFLLAGCEEEASLSARSVVEAGETERERTELDKWILDTFTRPYGIEVEYRWDKNAVQNGSYIYPPEVANVKVCSIPSKLYGLTSIQLLNWEEISFCWEKILLKYTCMEEEM